MSNLVQGIHLPHIHICFTFPATVGKMPGSPLTRTTSSALSFSIWSLQWYQIASFIVFFSFKNSKKIARCQIGASFSPVMNWWRSRRGCVVMVQQPAISPLFWLFPSNSLSQSFQNFHGENCIDGAASGNKFYVHHSISKNARKITFTSDLDIRAFLGVGDEGVFHCELWNLVFVSYQ